MFYITTVTYLLNLEENITFRGMGVGITGSTIFNFVSIF